MIWAVQIDRCQELLEDDSYLLETFVVLNVVLDELAACKSLMRLWVCGIENRVLVEEVLVLLDAKRLIERNTAQVVVEGDVNLQCVLIWT